MPDQISVCTADMMPVITGLQGVETVKPHRGVLCAQSAAALSSIKNMRSDREDFMTETHQSPFRLHRLRPDVRLCWTPAHAGVKGHEGADKSAKKINQGKGC